MQYYLYQAYGHVACMKGNAEGHIFLVGNIEKNRPLEGR
jgi:hypothetical protein